MDTCGCASASNQKIKILYNKGRSVLHKKGEGAGVPSKEEKTSCSLKGNIISKTIMMIIMVIIIIIGVLGSRRQ